MRLTAKGRQISLVAFFFILCGFVFFAKKGVSYPRQVTYIAHIHSVAMPRSNFKWSK